ncbi:hypothetical protein KFL_005290080 [Klebsormidium nitens]|uniref:Uncharacterized protein n=1 Tax=Klebsormidium nitens TaxID=105231 RepID=A0A1Y1IFS7_KLENI|nr:hypothetical protein KFL_005290080 [Klebsormidium nitens]|eukprot:GAQ89493.1 hypothetical protein KFL_005290080 [Klebsormidium nitens]
MGEGPAGGGGKAKMSQTLTILYAALVAIGGVVAYMKKGSKDSLIAASVSSILLVSAAALIGSNHVLYGSILGLAVSGALLYVMGSRFLKSRKVMPAGLVSAISLIMSFGYFHGIQKAFH